MENRIEIIQRLNRAKWDNNLLAGIMLFLGSLGICGVYSTVDNNSSSARELPSIISRKPPRIRRKDYMISDSTGNGLKNNALATAY